LRLLRLYEVRDELTRCTRIRYRDVSSWRISTRTCPMPRWR